MESKARSWATNAGLLRILQRENLHLRRPSHLDDRLLFVGLKFSGHAHLLIEHAIQILEVLVDSRQERGVESSRLALAEVDEANSVLRSFSGANDLDLDRNPFADVGFELFGIGCADDRRLGFCFFLREGGTGSERHRQSNCERRDDVGLGKFHNDRKAIEPPCAKALSALGHSSGELPSVSKRIVPARP